MSSGKDRVIVRRQDGAIILGPVGPYRIVRKNGGSEKVRLSDPEVVKLVRAGLISKEDRHIPDEVLVLFESGIQAEPHVLSQWLEHYAGCKPCRHRVNSPEVRRMAAERTAKGGSQAHNPRREAVN
jgi:hypothetical protein